MRFFAVVFSIFALATISSGAEPLDAVFARIDAAAKTFKGITAAISNTQYTALVDDNEVQTGTIKLLRVKPDLTRALVDLKGPHGGQTFALNGNQALVYNPKTKIVAVHDIAKYHDAVNQYLLLGFGSTSAALMSAYDVIYVGEEKIGTQTASHLRLVPKAKDTLRSLKQADLWFGASGLAVQQKFLSPSGDYKLVTYSDMKVGPVPENELDLKPKGATFQKMEN